MSLQARTWTIAEPVTLTTKDELENKKKVEKENKWWR